MASISVIIPIFNKEEYITECLNSVVAQTLDDIEILCIDDGSTDRSAEVVEEYNKGNIKLIKKENTGVGDSRNIGIDHATGKYICFMDPDDYYPSDNVLATLYAKAESNNVLICGGSFSSLKNGKIINKYSGLNTGYVFSDECIKKYSDYQFDYGFQRFIYNRKFISENKIRFPNYIRFQDPPFFTKAMSLAEKFYAVPIATYCYREAYKSINWTLSKKVDNLQGMYDCIMNANNNNLLQLQNLICSRLTSKYYQNIMLRNDSRYENKVILNYLNKITKKIDKNCHAHGELIHMINYIDRLLEKTQKPPKCSVIIPVYNVESYIEECLCSVINQTFNDFEIICVDDGTKDDSAEICERYAVQYPFIKVIHKFNGGLSNARNTGADFASGKYLYFLDSDDTISENALERIYECMDENKLDVLFFDAETFFDNKKIEKTQKQFKNTYTDRMNSSNVITGPELLRLMIKNDAYRSPVQLSAVSSEFYKRINLQCYPAILHEDNLYTTEALINAKRSMYIAEKLYHRRMREDSIMTSTKSFKNFYGYMKCYVEMDKLIHNSDSKEELDLLITMRDKNKKSAKTVYDYLNLEEKLKINNLEFEDRAYMALDPPMKKPSEWKKPPLIGITYFNSETTGQNNMWDVMINTTTQPYAYKNNKQYDKKINSEYTVLVSEYVPTFDLLNIIISKLNEVDYEKWTNINNNGIIISIKHNKCIVQNTFIENTKTNSKKNKTTQLKNIILKIFKL